MPVNLVIEVTIKMLYFMGVMKLMMGELYMEYKHHEEELNIVSDTTGKT